MDKEEDLICYCFQQSKAKLREAVISGSEEQFINHVKEKMQVPGCFCETANPSGKCCLSDINAYISQIKDRND